MFLFVFKLVVGEGIEPSLGPNLGRTDYKSVDTSNYMNPPISIYYNILRLESSLNLKFCINHY